MKHIILVAALLILTADVVHAQSKDTARGVRIFQFVDEPPTPGYSLQEYLANNLKYPKKAMENDIEGRVVVKFVINEDGGVSDAEVVHSVHELLDAEALRVVRHMPRWKPGKQNKNAVKVYFNLPIMFKLEDPEPPKDNEPEWKKK
jgi:protein TonB